MYIYRIENISYITCKNYFKINKKSRGALKYKTL